MKVIRTKQRHVCECGNKVVILKPSMYGRTKKSKRKRQRRFICREDHYLCKRCVRQMLKTERKRRKAKCLRLETS